MSPALEAQLKKLRESFNGRVYTIAMIDDDECLVLTVPNGAQNKDCINPMGLEVELTELSRGVSNWGMVEEPFIMRVSAKHASRIRAVPGGEAA